MKTIFCFLVSFVGFFQISCQKEPVEYDAAVKLCISVKKNVKVGEGQMTMMTTPTDCLMGAQLPDFTQESMTGKMINRDYFKGKISVINFWHVGCRPCEEELPVLNELVEKYKDQSVNFLAIGMNTTQDVGSFLIKHPFNFDHIPYGYSLINETFQFKWFYPFTIIADQNLKIIEVISHKLDDEKMMIEIIPIIDKALKEI